MRGINKIDNEDMTQFESIKAEFQSYLGYDAENERRMAVHPAVSKRRHSIDRNALKDMTDADFLALLIELWQHTEFKTIFNSLWQTESFSKLKNTLIETKHGDD